MKMKTFSPINYLTSKNEFQVKEEWLMEVSVKKWAKLHIEIRMIVNP